MAKNFKVDINSFSTTNDMDDIYAGATPIDEIATPNTKIKQAVNKVEKSKNKTIIDYKKNNGTNKKNNYTVTYKIDADIEDYLKNILWINHKTMNQYVNDLIREDMLKRLNLSKDATYKEIQKNWEKFKKANNI